MRRAVPIFLTLQPHRQIQLKKIVMLDRIYLRDVLVVAAGAEFSVDSARRPYRNVPMTLSVKP